MDSNYNAKVYHCYYVTDVLRQVYQEKITRKGEGFLANKILPKS